MVKIVDIILVNWNSGELALSALAPYLHYTSSKISCNIIVVDNASSDDSTNLLNSFRCNRIINKENKGFSKACNQAFQLCKGEYILLLNPDTESNPLVLEELLGFMEKNPEYAITGPSQFDKSGMLLKTCARFPTFISSLYGVSGLSKLLPNLFTPSPQMTDWNHSESSDVDHVMGSYMLIRRSVVERTGFMDEDYFLYLEDLDFSKRVALAGYKTFYSTKSRIIHNAGTTGQQVKSQRLFYFLESRATYWKKYFRPIKYLILISVSFIIEPFLRIADSLIKERKLNLKIITSSYWLYFKKLVRQN